MSSLMHRLLREPALGGHVKRLDNVPQWWHLLEYDVMDVDYANWILTLALLCPSVFSLAIPITLPGDHAAAAFRDLARKVKLRYLLFCLSDDEDPIWDIRIFHKCQDLLAGLDLSRCESLELPPIDGEYLEPPHRAPILIPSKCLILQDCFDVWDPAFLSRYFDLRNVRSVEIRPSTPEGINLSLLRTFQPTLETLTLCGVALEPLPSWIGVSFPCLRQLALHKFDLVFGDLAAIVRQFPLIRSLDFTRSVWNDDSITDRAWLESLPSLRHLQTLRTGTIYCESTSACRRIRTAITGYCDRNGISVTCTLERLPTSSDSLSSVVTSPSLYDSTPRCVCCGVPVGLDSEQNVGDSEGQQDWSEDDDDSAVSDWLRRVSVADPDVPNYERFNRDGIPWHWVFDARGRPTAVPDDLAFHAPSAASAGDPAFSDDEDDVVTEASIECLPALPDVPRLEDGYEAQDTDDNDEDEDGDGFGPEPWLNWSEFCDFDAADSAWVRFDIDDEGREIVSSEGEISDDEEEQEGKDDKLVSEDGSLSRF